MALPSRRPRPTLRRHFPASFAILALVAVLASLRAFVRPPIEPPPASAVFRIRTLTPCEDCGIPDAHREFDWAGLGIRGVRDLSERSVGLSAGEPVSLDLWKGREHTLELLSIEGPRARVRMRVDRRSERVLDTTLTVPRGGTFPVLEGRTRFTFVTFDP